MHRHPDNESDERDPDTDSAAAYLERLRAGDHAALEPLAERTRPWLERLAALRLRKLPAAVADPRDLVQEAWLRTLPALPRLEARDGDLVGVVMRYLVTTICSIARDLLMRQARWRSAEAPLLAEFDPALADVPDETRGILTRVMSREAAGLLHETLEAMDPIDREVLLLCGIEQRRQSEVAAALEVTEAVVKQRYARARRRLRDRLAHSLLDELDAA